MTRIKIIVWYRFSIAVKSFRSTCSFRSSTMTTMVVLRTNWAWPFLLRTHRRFPTASLQTPSMALRSWSIWATSDWAWAASVLRFPPVKVRTNNNISLYFVRLVHAAFVVCVILYFDTPTTSPRLTDDLQPDGWTRITKLCIVHHYYTCLFAQWRSLRGRWVWAMVLDPRSKRQNRFIL